MNYQEKILNGMLNTMSNDMQYSKYTIIETMKDCFAISRLEIEIGALSRTAPFNQEPREQMAKLQDELNEILLKYPNTIDG